MLSEAFAGEDVTDAAPEAPATLLFVDDEANILSSLKRLFRPLGYRVLTADSGAEALRLCRDTPIGLVISDMRMPEMTGAQLLEKIHIEWPDMVRILLTGYSDMGSTIEAINKGRIYRYIAKPWDDGDITLAVKQALEQRHLQREKRRLEALTLKQNEQLKALNASLEDKVAERTQELNQAMGFLEITHRELKENFQKSIRMLASLIELRDGSNRGQAQRVAELSARVAQHMKMGGEALQDVVFAGLLHNIGKLGLSDAVFAKPASLLSAEERAQLVRAPVKGQGLLMGFEQLKGAAMLIRAHRERFDGAGFPDHLSGIAIPLGARIIAVVADYDALQGGQLSTKRMSAQEAREFIVESAGKRYDPSVVQAFLEALGERRVRPSEEGVETFVAKLKAGMRLTRDLVTREGVLLLAKNHVLDAGMIEQLRAFEISDGTPLAIYVKEEL